MAREDTIRGLRELADFLDANPALPAPDARTFQYSVDVGRTMAERRSEVERVAAVLGVEPVDTGHYAAERAFYGVIYRAVSCDPGPKPGVCAICNFNPVHRADAGEHLSARLCAECLAPVLAVIDPDAVTS